MTNYACMSQLHFSKWCDDILGS